MSYYYVTVDNSHGKFDSFTFTRSALGWLGLLFNLVLAYEYFWLVNSRRKCFPVRILYTLFHISWSMLNFNRNQLGTVSA